MTEITLINGQKLVVGQTVDYKSATDNRTSIGKILEFRFAGFQQSDRSSIWMNIQDAQEDAATEWISVNVWQDQVDAGLFADAKPKPNGNKKSEAAPEYPF